MISEIWFLVGALITILTIAGIGWKASNAWNSHIEIMTKAVTQQHKEQTDLMPLILSAPCAVLQSKKLILTS